ncbi:glycosyltransferase [Buttiauxella agrestis]|uniref:Alpha-L-Rha alpha-1,3-L-rhamnosyltransferase n=1 Tax=Buttiauxella agrestis ATCC 33320 TaxID=1006004 RepID=A0A085GB58_9ENTR|nr:glycosyltransferase [Buttiauxella agrestis]KFC80953.1 alpha-L-Rha alpha-1,3-L-rhamnosyltransferase [Buttiauxella agrestis ATCC 33320]
MKKISVCIPTYNGEKYIKEQLDSILDQLSDDDEIIISDDHSTDGTLAVITSINDSRIKVFMHDKVNIKGNKTEVNVGLVSNNLQNALKYAQGDVIYLADQDDIWMKGRVSKTLPLFNNKNNINQVVICDCTIINNDRSIINHSYFSCINAKDSILNTIYKNPYLGCCMCFSKDLLKETFPFPGRNIGHDLWIGLIGKIYGKVIFINEPLILYRRHDMAVSTSGAISKTSIFFKIKYRIYILLELLKRVFH